MQPGRARLTALATALFALLLAPLAGANGRYPFAQQLAIGPNDPTRLWLRATYGVLTSSDSGETWNWICEGGVGYGPGEDPPLLVTADGAVLAATAQGVLETRDGGCTWTLQPDLGDRFAVDSTATPDGSRTFVLTNEVQSTGSYDLVVWRSDDQGHRFDPVGPPISGDLAGLTLDVAPSDPERLYVTAVPVVGAPTRPADGGAADAAPTEPAGVLLRSTDGGRTWERSPIGGSAVRDWPLIAAVDPTNPDTLWVRVRGRPKARGEFIESWLLYSSDAGDTWKEVFRGSADMLGFAVGEGGSPVWLGLGDSHDEGLQRTVDEAALGLYRADGPEGPFVELLEGQIGCLSRTTQGLYVCGSHVSNSIELGLSTDEGRTVAPVLDFGAAILGPLSCELGNAKAFACATTWPNVCGTLRACRTDADAGLPPMKPPEKRRRTDAGCGVAGGSGGSPAPLAFGAAACVARAIRRRRKVARER